MTSPVVLHVPHASRAIPPEVRAGIGLSDASLSHELDVMTDSHTDTIAERAAALAEGQARVVAAPVSRLVVDVERFTDGSEPMEKVGMGPVYTRTHDRRVLRESVDPALLDQYFHPHARAVEDAVTGALDEHGRALVIDVHSYPSRRLPYEMVENDAPRPEICLGTDPFHTPEWLLEAAKVAFGGFDLSLDTPFAGTYVPLERHHRDPRVTAIMIEVRRDVYMDEATVAPHAGLDAVTRSLAALIAACAAPPAAPDSLAGRARSLAIAAHRGQADKAGVEYWRHPARVAGHVRALYPDAPEEAVAVAWLHDVIEDTPWTAAALESAGFPGVVVEAVVALTRVADVSGDAYYGRIRDLGGWALMVKHADIADNTDEARLALLDPAKAAELRGKYAHARELLGL